MVECNGCAGIFLQILSLGALLVTALPAAAATPLIHQPADIKAVSLATRQRVLPTTTTKKKL